MIALQLIYPAPSLRPRLPRPEVWPSLIQNNSDAAATARPANTSGDEELINAVIAGDQRAFRYLVERYQNHVARTVTGMLGKSQDVDDCVQDVFIRLYSSLERFRGESSVKTYVTRIAINRSLDVLRKKRRSFFSPLDSSEVEMVESDIPGPDDDALFADQRRLLRTALDSLAPQHRSVVVLRLIDGMSTAETADVLGVRYGTVLSRLTRALAKLKLALAEDGILTASDLNTQDK